MSKSESHTAKKRKLFHKTKREKGEIQGTTEEVLLADVRDLLKPRLENTAPDIVLPERFSEVEVKIEIISSTGDGLGFATSGDHVYVVPFTAPGDMVLAKVVTHFENHNYTLTDFIKVIEPGAMRDNSHIRCPYFSRCSGCQFQMLSYDKQLKHKKTVVERAYRNFSNLKPEAIPAVQDTMASPLQYGYRTKLTPHFDGPRNARKDKRAGNKPAFAEVPPIGFMIKNTRKTLDIEDCPIGTDAVREGMKAERGRVKRDIGTYQRGATLLLRESTHRIFKDSDAKVNADQNDVDGSIRTQSGTLGGINRSEDPAYGEMAQDGQLGGSKPFEDTKICITDNNATTTEYIGDYVFTNPAGAFFQNNNSILLRFTEYVKSLVLSPTTGQDTSEPPITHLIDAYCGSGLFTITLSSLGLVSTGIDISSSSIDCAKYNANLNKLSPSSTKFHAADASAIFADIASPPKQTVVIIDPPRKGCDKNFLNQLLLFGPRRLVYVSCNVHTQARDVAVLVEGISKNHAAKPQTVRYELKSLRGLDFFPQTGHVESVALLDRSME